MGESVGCHPQNKSYHRAAVLYGVICYRGLTPIPWVNTHGYVISPLRGSMWLPCNNYALCIMNYALKKAHGCGSATATRFRVVCYGTVG